MSERKHGTYGRYAKDGCRCDQCREYQRARVERNRRERLATDRLSHGTLSAWDAGCRCLVCSAAKYDARHAYEVDGARPLRKVKGWAKVKGRRLYVLSLTCGHRVQRTYPVIQARCDGCPTEHAA